MGRAEFQAADQITIFLDTNIFLHYPPLKKVDWRKLAHAKAVELVLCEQVLHELDDKKNDAYFAERAKHAIKEIRAIRTSGQPVTEGVTLTVFIQELRSGDEIPRSVENGDARIVHQIKKYMEAHPDRTVAVCTEDYGMEERCRANGLKVVTPDEDTRRESPKSEQEKKLTAMAAELAHLKNRLPVLNVVARVDGQKTVHEEVLLGEGVPQLHDPVAEIAEQESLLRDRKADTYPQRLLRGTYLPATEQERYERESKAYLAQYERYIRQLNETIIESARLLRIQISLLNEGHAPAEDVDVHIFFPAIFSTFELDSDEVARRLHPLPPTPPTPPQTIWMQQLHELHQMQHRSELAHAANINALRREPEDDGAIRTWIEGQPAGGHAFRASFRKLKHSHAIELGTVVAVIASWDHVKPFEATYWVSAANHPDRLEGKLVFKVRRKPTTGEG